MNYSCICFSLCWCPLYKQDLCWPILYLHQHKWTILAYRSLFGEVYCTSRTFGDLVCSHIYISELFLHILLLWWCLLCKRDLCWLIVFLHQHKWTILAYASPFGDVHYTSRTFVDLFYICINISELFLHILLPLVMSTVQEGPLVT